MEGSKSRRATWRMGARERLGMQRLAVVLICLLLLLALRPTFLGIVQGRDFQNCQSNVRRMSRGLDNYRQDWDDTLPLAANWTYSLQGVMSSTSGTGFSVQSFFHCPRDHSGAPSSYAYNELLSGVSLSTLPSGKDTATPAPRLFRPERAPLIIERHGSPENARLPLANWDDVLAAMTRPHDVPPAPTGSLVMGSGQARSRNNDELNELKGKKF